MKVSQPCIILTRPKAAGNIGAIGRVMANFNLNELRIIDESREQLDDPPPFNELDWALATKRGQQIIENAKHYKSLQEAIADCHWVLGSSGKRGNFERGYARPIHPPKKALEKACELLKENIHLRWALVFGPEDDGLNSHEASLCHQLVRVPTNPQAPSMNLAMCAGVLIYHWSLLQQEHFDTLGWKEQPSPQLATEADKEKFVNYVMDVLQLTSFFKYPDHENVRSRIRRWLQQGQIPRGELLFAFEILYQIRSWGEGQHSQRNFLKEDS